MAKPSHRRTLRISGNDVHLDRVPGLLADAEGHGCDYLVEPCNRTIYVADGATLTFGNGVAAGFCLALRLAQSGQLDTSATKEQSGPILDEPDLRRGGTP